MNQLATQQERLPMDSVGLSTGSAGAKLAPQNLAEVVKFAEVMCRADIALPKHLRGNAGACMAVALQALDWSMNPFAVASKSYSVNGQIAYEAQLIVAVVNTRSGIEGRIRYAFEGEGADRVCIASGKLEGEMLEVRSPRFKDITPKNSPLWKSDPDQQQCYYTGRSWARRFTPEVILGVYDRDEVEQFRGPDGAKDVTPSVMDRLKAQNATQEPQGEREGFSRAFIADQTDEQSGALTGEIIDNPHSASADPAPSGQSPDNDETAPVSSQEDGGEVIPPSASSPSSSILTDADRVLFIECAFKLFAITVQEDLDGPAKRGVLASAKDDWKEAIRPEHHPKLASIFLAADSIITGKNTNRAGAIREVAGWLECAPSEIGGEE